MIRTEKAQFKAPPNNATDAEIKAPFPGYIYVLFYVFSVFLVLPLYNLPLIGLSVTAPLMFIIAVPCLFKPPHPWFHTYRLWIFLAVTLWVGITLSTIINGITGTWAQLESRGVLYIVRYFYWILTFLLTVYFASQKQVLKKLSALLGWSVLTLSIMRLGEAVFLGILIGTGRTRFFTQNTYGVLFSTFAPFLMVQIFKQGSKKPMAAILANLMLLAAVAINGSRGSWLAIGLGVSLAIFLLLAQNPKKFSGVTILLVFAAVLIRVAWGAFPQVSSAVEARFDTFNKLEYDKSTLIRELMVQKGIRLFIETPLIGIGAGQFTRASISLDIPKYLSYAPQEHFDSKSAHNSYVQYLAEFGLAGAIPFGIFLIILVIQGGKTTLMGIKTSDFVPLSVFLSFLQMSIHFLAISSITTTSSWFIYGLVGAVIMAYRGISEE